VLTFQTNNSPLGYDKIKMLFITRQPVQLYRESALCQFRVIRYCSIMDKRSDTNQENRRSDRRTLRTRRQLRDALLNLVLEKGYDSVTIEDITERADLGRTTFYLHYHDKEELLLESIDSISEELMAQIAPIPPSAWNQQPDRNDPRDPIRIVFKHAADNSFLYLIILRGEGAIKAASKVQSIISQKVIEVLHDSIENGAPIQPLIPEEVFGNYLAGSLLGMLTWWLETKAPYTPEEMAAMFRQLFFEGGKKTLGLS
jgi:AcrR family transcriptional regulator